MEWKMKNYCLLALSLFAASLFADDDNAASNSKPSLFRATESETSASSLLGEKEIKPLKPMRPPSFVFLDSPPYVFEIKYNSLILQPTANNLHYAAQANPLPAPTPNWIIHDIPTDYHYGFDLCLSGNIPSTCTNISVDWEHFHSTDSDSTSLPSSDMIGPFFEIGPDASPYNKARGQVQFHFDQVNLDYGIFVHFGSRLRTNFFSGIGIARIKETLKNEYSNPSGDIERTIETPSKFTGAGPRFGVNFSYQIVKGFQFGGGFAADFFMGTLENKTEYSSISPALASVGVTPPNQQSTHTSNRMQLVPGFEGNLNLAYAWIFREHFVFKLVAGYEVQVYLNAIQSTDIGSEVNTPPVVPDTVGVYARTFQRISSNFALSGPFVKVIFGF